MFFSDNLFFIVLFSTPATIFILYNKFVRPIPKVESDETVRISSAMLFSFVTLFVDFTVLQFSRFPLEGFLSQVSVFSNIRYLLIVMSSIVAISFSLCAIWNFITRNKLIKSVINKLINKKFNMAETTRNSIIFADIFDDDFLNVDILKDCVVKIESADLSAVGILYMFSSCASSKIEFVLRDTSRIQAYFEHDNKAALEDDKFFSNILYEYVDLAGGYKVTFYDTAKFKKYKQGFN